MTEPRLSVEDLRIWGSWQRTAELHSRTRQHQRRVDQARRVVSDVLLRDPTACCMWSAGKDSTAMAHLVHEMAPDVLLVSEKDDLDYPGEREYVETLARRWGARLQVVTPNVSPREWIARNATGLAVYEDFHSRVAELSKACFYRVVEEASDGHAILLGLRSEESRGRLMNRATHGLLYQSRDRWVACPLGDWSGIDVYAYLVSQGVDLLPLYRCVAFMHAREPWRVRKSWWLPGAHGRHGGVAWLRHYYPALYRQLVEWIPAVQGAT